MNRVLPQRLHLLHGGVGFDVWEYVTPHSLAEIGAEGYFWPVVGRLKRLDKIVGYAEADSDHPVAFELIVARVIPDQTRIVVVEHVRPQGIQAPHDEQPLVDAVAIERKRGPGRPRKEAA